MNLDFLCLTKRDLENQRFDSLCRNGAGSANVFIWLKHATLGYGTAADVSDLT